ncbi:hypothetical protein [Rhodohalobacter sp. 8-1]|uniref:hypothetical protein n=1 Tax=Rhodohalobacter sp. 8-1 TaxID=3131972 RepID=UPI0030EEDD88
MQKKATEFSLVVVGNMPTTLFTPQWLLNHGLLSKTEADNAKIHVISPKITSFDIAEWGKLEIRPDRLVFGTVSDSHHEIIKDIVLSLITAVEGNELNFLGVNFTYHFTVSENDYLDIGRKLAPFENWANIISNPKMERIEMVQEERSDGHKGKVRIRVQPSRLIEKLGVEFRINNHFERVGVADQSSKEFINLLNNFWFEAQDEANKKFNFFLTNLDIT